MVSLELDASGVLAPRLGILAHDGSNLKYGKLCPNMTQKPWIKNLLVAVPHHSSPATLK